MKLFIDSMVYLHYRNLEDIDFPALLDVVHVSVVVPRITLRELDKQKNTHSSSRIRDRARRVLLKIEGWIGVKGNIRTNVQAEFFPSAPNIDFARHGLNPDWNDDVLIASILQYKTLHPSEDVVLITQDSGPRLTAQALGIKVFQLPDEYKLPSEPDPMEIENRELAKALERLKNALPKLVVGFAGSEEEQVFARFVLPPPPDTMEKEVARKIDDLRSKLPKQHPPDQEQPKNSITDLQHQWAALSYIDPIPPEEYERYNRDVDAFLSQYEKYMCETWEVQASAKRTISFEIEIRNIGTAPAEDVDVEFRFPGGFQLLAEEDLPDLPAEPRPPRKPRSRMQMIYDNIGRIPNFHLPSPTLPDFKMTTSFKIERTGSYTVSDHFERIKHGSHVVLPEMFLVFDSYDSAASFNCQYTLRLANLPDAVNGQLHFVIEKEGANKGMEGDE
jgi:hypothetical protein